MTGVGKISHRATLCLSGSSGQNIVTGNIIKEKKTLQSTQHALHKDFIKL